MTQRGSSGAVIDLHTTSVTKTHVAGGERLLAQYDWLNTHRSPVVPAVIKYTRLLTATESIVSYDMERLVKPPVWALDHDTILVVMLNQLQHHVWSRPPVVRFNPQDLYVKMGYISTEHSLSLARARLFNVFKTIRWDDLPACLTHGDPTFDNVMFREETSDLVLIDPIPATSAVPDLRCVDYGKIIQSLVGFEHVRYGDASERFHASQIILKNRIDDQNEWQASVFWCIVHLMRAFPYVPPDVQPGLRMCMEHAFSLL